MARIRFVFSLFAVCLSAHPSFADEAVSVRSSAKDDYTRIVFEWPKPPSYVTEKTGTALTLKFQGAAAFKVDGSSPTSLPRVVSYATPDANTAVIGFIAGQDVRHFEIGNRVIVDIRGPEKATGDAQKKIAETKTEALPPEKPQPEKTATPPVNLAAKVEETKAARLEPSAAPKAEKTAPKTEDKTSAAQATIQITSTEMLGLAAFERFGNLWIVIDVPDYPLQPQIAGKDAKQFGAFERVPLKEATAFRLALPDKRSFHAEGGGLLWKISTGAAPNAEFIPLALVENKESASASLLWPVPNARRVVELNDPVIGDVLKVVTVDSAKFNGSVQNYAEFGTLRSFAGLAVESRIDDLSVKKTPEGILISGKNGLSVSPETDTAALRAAAKPAAVEAPALAAPEAKPPGAIPPEEKPPAAENIDDPLPADAAAPVNADVKPEEQAQIAPSAKFFPFDQWKMGDAQAAQNNQKILIASLMTKTDEGKAVDLLTLGKMQIAHGRGPEARGYLDLATQMVPELETNPEVLAVKGVADTLSGEYEKGLREFSNETLKDVAEISLWKSYALASLEDWSQAADTIPKDPAALSLLAEYPEPLRTPVSLALTEVALRDGDLPLAENLMKITETGKDLSLPYKSALDYMRGEALRQQGKTEETEKLWGGLAKGRDDLYRAKAGLALTTLQLDKKKIKPAEAIDRLEGLRYAWRGDELETAINHKLGQVYVANNEPIKGLVLLRQAASLSPSPEKKKAITDEMARTFKSVFEPNRIKDVNPVDAISLYNEFSSLVPAEAGGHKIVRQLADRLVGADLLPRAANLLESQINSGKLASADGAATSLRLASVYLQDGKPDKALAALAKADAFLGPASTETILKNQIVLLRAQALSDQKKPEEALALLAPLEQTGEVLRMRADIAWSNKRWQDAADALEELTTHSEISPSRPVNDEEADLLLNWAVALYLADNRYVLANLREKYSAAMAAHEKAKQFEVVTRPRQSSLVSNRDTIDAIIEETEIFKGFVDSSRILNSMDDAKKEPAAKAAEIAPVAPAQPPVTAPAALSAPAQTEN